MRAALADERPGAAGMAEEAAGEILRGDLLRYRRSSRGWMYTVSYTHLAAKKLLPDMNR